ncbi:MAG: hypothetical protein JRJ59_11705 [Deltaproteobacteria bacterium]|nr:hypothetical protein [Deltaproteobacteria bacterium]
MSNGKLAVIRQSVWPGLRARIVAAVRKKRGKAKKAYQPGRMVNGLFEPAFKNVLAVEELLQAARQTAALGRPAAGYWIEQALFQATRRQRAEQRLAVLVKLAGPWEECYVHVSGGGARRTAGPVRFGVKTSPFYGSLEEVLDALSREI